MNRDQIMNAIGFLLVLLCFVWATVRIAVRAREEADPDRIVLRFAHWQLEGGIREAFDELAARYMEMHPHVRVEQMLIPERVYVNWTITQLVGGTAPDLIGIHTISEERMARYFTPLMNLVNQPNPYNEGTELEGVPWRDTFLDGLSGIPSYRPGLLDYYGIPVSMFTVRLYFNVDLYERIAGDRPLPTTFDELIELCELVNAYAAETGETIIPISGSRYNAPMIIQRLFSAMTQRMALEMDVMHKLERPHQHAWLAYLDGSWGYQSPPILSALSVMRSIGQHMQSGFLSLGRDDAMFYFVQERALMTATGSWDIGSIHMQAPFQISAFAIPMPAADHPEYGRYLLGPLSEAGFGAGAPFALTQQSEHPEQAIDFLHFVTSQAGNQLFTEVSFWLPSVIGVELPEKVQPFALQTEGFPDGLTLTYGADSQRILENNLHMLMQVDGSPEEFARVIDEQMPAAVLHDFRIHYGHWLRQWRRNDSLLGALTVLVHDESDPSHPDWRRFGELIEIGTEQENQMLWVEHELRNQGRSLQF